MKVVIRVYSIVLLAYTGWRTYDFISSQLPRNDLSFWLSIAFLFATEAGLVLWHETHLNHTSTREQEYIAKAMTWIDFVGSLAAGIADMILRQTLVQGYAVPEALAQFLIYGLPIIMALNVAAVILYEQNDAQTQEDRAEKQLRFEIHRQAMTELRKDRSAIAEGEKKAIYRKMKDNVTGRVAREYMKPEPQPTLMAHVPEPRPHANGKAVYNAEAEAENPTPRLKG